MIICCPVISSTRYILKINILKLKREKNSTLLSTLLLWYCFIQLVFLYFVSNTRLLSEWFSFDWIKQTFPVFRKESLISTNKASQWRVDKKPTPDQVNWLVSWAAEEAPSSGGFLNLIRHWLRKFLRARRTRPAMATMTTTLFLVSQDNNSFVELLLAVKKAKLSGNTKKLSTSTFLCCYLPVCPFSSVFSAMSNQEPWRPCQSPANLEKYSFQGMFGAHYSVASIFPLFGFLFLTARRAVLRMALLLLLLLLLLLFLLDFTFRSLEFF